MQPRDTQKQKIFFFFILTARYSEEVPTVGGTRTTTQTRSLRSNREAHVLPTNATSWRFELGSKPSQAT